MGDFLSELNGQLDFEYPYETYPDGDSSADQGTLTPALKPGPVVNKRKREGIQLCKVYDPAKPPTWKRVIFERKLDCYRCRAEVRNGKAVALTSTGLPHWNADFIIEDLQMAAAAHPSCDNIFLDGEIVHNTLPFDIAGGILRQHDYNPEQSGFVLHAWDTLPIAEFDSKTCSKTLIERKVDLKAIVDRIKVVGNNVTEVDWYEGPISMIDQYAREFVIEDGEEGIVAKDADGLYEFRKSGVWLKWKPKYEGDDVESMKEGDFRISGIKMGRGKHNGRIGSVYIEGYLLEDGNISPDPPEIGPIKKMVGKAGTGLDDFQRTEYLKWHEEGTLVGRCVEVRYQELSSKGKVRFPVFYRLRPDKD